jgi:hypothetical protein
MKTGISNRLNRLEVSRQRAPMAAAVIEPRPGEANQAAQVRHMAMHPEQIGAPTIFLRLSRREPCEAN